MKKFAALLITVLITMMTFTAVVSAATENDIITALRSAGVAESYIATAESYLAKSDVTITATQADSVIANIEAAKVIAGGNLKASTFTADQETKIAAEISAAAETMDLSTTYSTTDGISIIDGSGNVLLTAVEGSVKQTGFDYTIVILGLALIGTAGVSAVVIRKVTRREKKILEAA